MNRQKWLSILMFFFVLEIAVISIERARWITPQPLLTLVLILSMLTTWLLYSQVRIHNVLKHAAILIIGSLVTLWQSTGAAAFGQGTIYFAIFLVLLTWLVGYISTWYFMKNRNVWMAVILGAVIVLVNLSNLPGEYYYFFGIYFVVAILLVVQNRILRQDYQKVNNAANRKGNLRYFTMVLVSVSMIAVLVSWVIPVAKVPQFETWVATNTLWSKNIKESSLNFFSYVMAKQPRSTSSARRSLGFGEKWHQKEEIHFIVNSERPAYWQVHVYDEYTSKGWTNSPLAAYMLDKNDPWENRGQYAKQITVTNTVETELKTDILLTAGEFTSADTSVFVHESKGEVIAITTPRLFKPGESYVVTSSISAATPDELAAAGEVYPQSIIENYLQLPDEFPESIKILSANITRDAITPYGQVMAIDRYLSRFPYSEEVEPPPADVDIVEYFLTTQKTGFCTYFASAMVVMLRSVEVPSRLAVGYLPGERGQNADEYVLRDKHYHAWAQVYFPEFGWVNIEATPASGSSPGAIETPVVSSPGVQPGGPFLTSEFWGIPYWQYDWWDVPYGPYDQLVPPGNAAVRSTNFYRQRWPFAEALGRTLTAFLIAALVISFIATVLLTFRSRFYKWLWKVVRTDPVRNVYSRLCVLGAMAEVGPGPHQTPLEYSALLVSEFPAQAKAVNYITQTYMDNQFGRKDSILSLTEEAELLKARREVYQVILNRLGFFSFFGKLFRRLLR